MRKTAKIPDNASIADACEEHIGYHVRRLSVKVMADFANELKPLDLNPADASILFVIGSNPGVTQSLVGKILGILRPFSRTVLGRQLAVFIGIRANAVPIARNRNSMDATAPIPRSPTNEIDYCHNQALQAR